MKRAENYILKIIDNIVEITYCNGYVSNINGLKRLKNQLKTLEDKLIYNHTVSMRSALVDTFGITHLTEHNTTVYDTISYLKEQLKDAQNKYIFDKFDHISEIKYIYENSVIAVRLQNGCIHCDYDKAFYIVDGDYYLRPIYALYGQYFDYNEWNKHPEVRKNKILNIKYKNRFKLNNYYKWW